MGAHAKQLITCLKGPLPYPLIFPMANRHSLRFLKKKYLRNGRGIALTKNVNDKNLILALDLSLSN